MNKYTTLLIAIILFYSFDISSQSIGSVSPNNSDLDNILTVTITGINTTWGQETGTFWTMFTQNSTTILPISNEVIISPTEIQVDVNVPTNATLGDYDVWRGNLILQNSFTVQCGTILGCIEPSACNYNSTATCSDGSCVFPGCTNILACNYALDAGCDDGSCLIDYGCNDVGACNYNDTVTCNDGSCTYPGCTNTLACNYNSMAGCDDGSCILEESGCTDSTANNYNPLAGCEDGSCAYGAIIIVDPNTSVLDNVLTVTITGLNTSWGQETGTFWTMFTQNSTTVLPTSNEIIISPTEIQVDVTVPGDAILGDYDVWRNNHILDGGFSVVCIGGIPGCIDALACNYNSLATCDNGSCSYPGCTDSSACNYVPEAGCDDGSCSSIDGCMDSIACNYNSIATCNDFSCTYTGCTNSVACNYNSLAGCDDGSCIIGETGCTDSAAINYNPLAGCDDNSCLYYGIVLVEPNNSEINNILTVTITGLNTSWGQETGTFWTMFTQNSTTVLATSNEIVISPTEIQVDVTVPLDATLGDYDVWRNNLGKTNAFSVVCDGGIPGCIDSSACNYSSVATCSNNTCTYPGCTNSSACNYNPNAGCDDGSCYLIFGCTDPYADNFNSSVNCPDNSLCIYTGCSNMNACNYNSNVTIDDGSCIYGISGTIYYDENMDGFQNGFENGFENWTVIVQPINVTAYSGANGLYYVELPAGDYFIEAIPPNANWTSVSPSSYNLTVASCSDVDFGFSIDDASWSYQSYPTTNDIPGIHCDLGYNAGVWFINDGSEAITGKITVEFSPIFNAESIFEQLSADSIGDGFAIWNLDSVTTGNSDFYEIHIIGPGTDFIGTVFDFVITYEFYDFAGVDVFTQSTTISAEVLCSYDPNDKNATPIGYSIEHLILQGERIQYKVRFQNTGNYPAQDVVVQDTLSSYLDWETFNPLYASHDMTTTFDSESGAIEFRFDEIYLPDSLSNEPESHGFLVYDVYVEDSLDLGGEIMNTAFIFFDGNEPIITNTTWHTVYACSQFNASFENVGPVLTAIDADQYQWYLNGEEIEEATGQIYVATESGNYSVELEIGVPCTDLSDEEFIFVVNIDELESLNFMLYPNPAKDVAMIVFEKPGDFTIHLVQSDGVIVKKMMIENTKKCKLDVEDLASGKYILIVKDNKSGKTNTTNLIIGR